MATDRKGFRFHQGDVYWFFTIDRPIHQSQVSIFDAEFDEEIDKIMLNPRTKRARLTKKWRNHLNSITHDGYGSFRLDFDSEMSDYTDAELEAFNDDIIDVVAYLPIVETIRTWIGMEEDIESYMEDGDPWQAMNDYIECVLASGYSIRQADVEEMFNEYFSNKDTVAQDFLVRKLKGQNVVLREPKNAESLTSVFEAA